VRRLVGATILDGKKISLLVKEELAAEVRKLTAGGAPPPGLAVVLVGDDPASRVYVRNKGRACGEVGIVSHQHDLASDATQDQLLSLVDDLNGREDINGILVQLPLPDHINSKTVLEAVNPEKDVDGFHPFNVGKLVANDATVLPCTPAGIIEILDRYQIPIEGRSAVIIGRSDIVGKPMALLLMHRHATITVCHSRTRGLPRVAAGADILVAAMGRARFVTADMVREGAVVIDVGMNRVDGKLTGDVDFDAVSEKASHITPVPGGVGPMTVAMLMKNTLAAYRKQTGR
jgi:methylenetetrahydrofolate dehydrogenase (NADP+)/methenyltetrahydrofolate cyclohydrolase